MHAVSNGLNHGFNHLPDSVGKTLAENFISVEVESNLSTRNGREELALSGLHKVPFDALKAYNRNRIFQQASSRLLSSELTVSPTSYLTLLVHYIPHIKKATDVVCQQLGLKYHNLTAIRFPTHITSGRWQRHWIQAFPKQPPTL